MRLRRDPETGLNELENSYVKERAKGKSPAEAYRDSNYKYNRYAAQEAYHIEQRDPVQAEIKRLKAAAASREALSREELAAYVLELAMDPDTSKGNKEKFLKLYSNICGYQNNSTNITLSGDIDIKAVREAAIDDLLKECKSSRTE